MDSANVRLHTHYLDENRSVATILSMSMPNTLAREAGSRSLAPLAGIVCEETASVMSSAWSALRTAIQHCAFNSS